MDRDAKPKVSIVIPAYNEEGRISGVLEKYSNISDSLIENYEIIVVCNGCIDETPNIVQEFAFKYGNIKLFNFDEKLGKGGAIIEGFRMAEGEFLGYVDSDDSTEPQDFINLINSLIELKVDGVIASRWVKGAIILTKQPLKRRVASRMFNVFIRILFDLPFNDTQCGAKIFKKDAVYSVLNKMKTRGFEFDVELLWRMKREGFHIEEIPTRWKHSEGSTFSLTNAKKMCLNLIKIRI